MARADVVVGREEIAAAVERLMRPDTAEAEAEDMRKRAALLKDFVKSIIGFSESLGSLNNCCSFLSNKCGSVSVIISICNSECLTKL
ncbi:hypothetical protein BDA96_04G334700 [Sorghum bicolor]|uniref:Uncharacterized protein n=2 Tax=Sorghum bicolor TaxID=4558 RepID=A0A921R8A8_SORBI|nr:hypothetical protein BDA96_05G200400 [Sorghum bicolor]KAG0535069.1 hypothetical protein BDA96_04G334700 [Sorghum bicolor]KXG31184.1 hypothetical protein SORBI_3004G312900 [Sorghum bicolor]